MREEEEKEIPKAYEPEVSMTPEIMLCKEFTDSSADFINYFFIVRTIFKTIA